MTRYHEPHARRRSKLLEALDMIAFLVCALGVILVLSLADVR